MYRRDVFWLYYTIITPYLHYWDYDMDLYQLWTTFDWVMDCFSFPSLPSLGLVDGAGSTAEFRFLAFARNWLARASAIYMGKRMLIRFKDLKRMIQKNKGLLAKCPYIQNMLICWFHIYAATWNPPHPAVSGPYLKARAPMLHPEMDDGIFLNDSKLQPVARPWTNQGPIAYQIRW